MPKYITLCQGNQGKQLIQNPHLQIRLYQLNKITQQQILKYILSNNQTSNFQFNQLLPIGLITKQRNYYIDMLLQQNQQLIIQTDQRLQAITKSKINLPLLLQLVYPQQQYKLQTNTIPTLKHFTILHKLSEGSFAEIFLAEIKYNRNLVAIKRINKQQYLKKSTKKQLLNQIEVMKYRYWGKVGLKWTFQNQNFVYLVMDYCLFGTVYDLIKKSNQIKGKHHKCEQCQLVTKQQKISIWIQVAFTIVHMHNKGYLYRDLKPQNILINYDGSIKLCDFGHSTAFKPNEKFNDLCGTLEYIPPQIVNGQYYDKTVDIYALGILFYELLNGKSPFSEITFENMKQLKSQAKLKYDKKLFTNQQISLISSLTSIKSQQRLGFTNSMNIFRHPFFQQQQTKQILYKVMKRQKDYQLLVKLDCDDMEKANNGQQIRDYSQVVLQKVYNSFLTQPFNYLKPNIIIQNKIGPKFNSAY